jgi:hypothetical protein
LDAAASCVVMISLVHEMVNSNGGVFPVMTVDMFVSYLQSLHVTINHCPV